MDWKNVTTRDARSLVLRWDDGEGNAYFVRHVVDRPHEWTATRLSPAPSMTLGTFLLMDPGTQTASQGTYTNLTDACNACARCAGRAEEGAEGVDAAQGSPGLRATNGRAIVTRMTVAIGEDLTDKQAALLAAYLTDQTRGWWWATCASAEQRENLRYEPPIKVVRRY